MMRKLLLLSSALLTAYFGANAQVAKPAKDQPVKNAKTEVVSNPALKTAGTPTLMVDTLHYYFNKYYFKTAVTSLTAFPYFKSSSATGTAITHCGSRFDVPAGETVTVTGLEAFMQKGNPNTGESGSPKIKVHLFLCNLNAQGMPILPPVDSIVQEINALAVPNPSLVGGNFTNTATPRTFTSSFAVCYRNMSTTSGDTVRLLRTHGRTPSSSVASSSNQCSDGGYGFVRFGHPNPQFYSTRDFTMMPGFGVGTDYEFIVAPRVTYSLQASQILPSQTYAASDSLTAADTACTRTLFTFTNTSSKFYEHRMYNLNTFYLKWALTGSFAAQPVSGGGFSSDSSITWRFEAFDMRGDDDDRIYLPASNNGTIKMATDRPSSYDFPDYCYKSNQFRARIRPMSIYGRSGQMSYFEDFKMCLKYCNDDMDGLSEVRGFENLKVYPNPAVNGRSTITGLQGKNTVAVYDLLGKLVSTQIVDSPMSTLDLSAQPAGTYFVKVSNAEHNTYRTVKIIKEN